MAMHVQPYLFFDGRCDEALDLYRRVLGAEVTAVMRYKESPDQSKVPPGLGDKVMHSSFRIGETELFASDGTAQGKPAFQGVSLSLTVADATDAERKFNALADGGKVQMPLAQTFFSPRFGMVADRFGVSWMIMAR
jgi:PhnB protein